MTTTNVETPAENKARFFLEAFHAAFTEQNSIHIQDVPEEHRIVFAVWRQHLGAVVIWYKQFARNKDYSSAINAAFALGKLNSIAKPVGYVEEFDLNTFENMGKNMWDELFKTHMRPVSDPDA